MATEGSSEEANFAEKHERACNRERDWRRKRRFKQDTPAQQMARFRVAELEIIFASRYGRILPDDDAGRDDLEIILHHLACIDITNANKKIIAWTGRWAPWLPQQEARQLAMKVARCPKQFTADHLAQRLNLTSAKRTQLGIRTIGAIDATKDERAEIAKRRRNDRRKAKRRAQGVRPRAEYEGQSLTKMKPWEADGISRATWYRRHSEGHEHYLAEAA